MIFQKLYTRHKTLAWRCTGCMQCYWSLQRCI